MPTDIKLKNSVTATNAPTSLQQGEVAINITDKKVWVGNAATTPVLLLGSGADGTFTNLTVSGVASFADGTVSLPSITNIGDTNTGIFFPAADTIAFTEGGVESMRIDSAGNVGIGTSSPASRLEVSGSSNQRNFIRSTSANAESAFQFQNATTGTASNDGFFVGLGGDQVAYFIHYENQAIQFATNGTDRMRIDGSGNVGIGTSSPGRPLDVSGIIRSRSSIEFTNGSASAVGYAGDNNQIFGSGAGDIALYSNAGNLRFYAASTTERMRIDSSGLVGIGTTTPSSFGGSLVVRKSNTGQGVTNATAQFSDAVNSALWIGHTSGAANIVSEQAITFGKTDGSTTTERMRIDSSGNLLVNTTSLNSGKVNIVASGASQPCMIWDDSDATSASQGIVSIRRNGSAVGLISTTNAITTYASLSDYRLKENIAPMTGALATVSALKPVTYKWKSTGEESQGFIAHELQAVVPDCVTGEKDAIDAEGNPVYQGVDTSFLVATLTAAIQEQQALIENLTIRLNALEGK
jgi:hypothetical protein